MLHRHWVAHYAEVQLVALAEQFRPSGHFSHVSPKVHYAVIGPDSQVAISQHHFKRVRLGESAHSRHQQLHRVFVAPDCSHHVLLPFGVELHVQEEHVVLDLQLEHIVGDVIYAIEQNLHIVLLADGSQKLRYREADNLVAVHAEHHF